MGEGLATWTLHLGSALDVLRGLPDASVSCCVTSPPYFGLRDYGHAEQIGLEGSPDAFVSALVSVFSEARRVLADDGVAFVNIGDSYVSSGGNTVAHGPGAQCGNTKAGVTPRVGGPRFGHCRHEDQRSDRRAVDARLCAPQPALFRHNSTPGRSRVVGSNVGR